MQKPAVRLHQIYRSNKSAMMVEIIGKKGGKFKARILTRKHDLFAGSHTFSTFTIAKEFTLVDKKTINYD